MTISGLIYFVPLVDQISIYESDDVQISGKTQQTDPAESHSKKSGFSQSKKVAARPYRLSILGDNKCPRLIKIKSLNSTSIMCPKANRLPKFWLT